MLPFLTNYQHFKKQTIMKPIQKELDEIVKFIEEDGKTTGENIPEECEEYDDDAYYYDPSEDGDLVYNDCPDYLGESLERVPLLQKEVQETQAELDEQLKLLGDAAIPSMIISVTRQGSGYNEDVFYTTKISISLKDGQIIKDCTQESTYSYSDMEIQCAEESEVLNQLRPLQLQLKLAKAGYKVIASHKL